MNNSDTAEPLLNIRNLAIEFDTADGRVKAVQDVSISVNRGECLGLVGESGSGKSQTMHAVMGLLDDNGSVSGSIQLAGQEILGLPPGEMNTIRGKRIGMIFQDPLTSLTPHMKIGRQMMEVLSLHEKLGRAEALKRVEEALELVRIPDARTRMNQFPHELSGGMRQRVMIAMSILCNPEVLIADEPTTALDVTIQAQILDIIKDLQADIAMAVVLVSHDMGVIAGICNRVAVMKSGRIVEQASTDDIFYAPQMDYTRALLDSMPRIDADDVVEPISQYREKVLEVTDMTVKFPVQSRQGLRSRNKLLPAVQGVNFELFKGETLGIVGESGCGKSTLARAVLRLIGRSDGSVLWLGKDLTKLDKQSLSSERKDLQIVFQDPLASLNPRMTIGQSISEPLWTHRPELSAAAVKDQVRAMMDRVGLSPQWINRYPHEFSGGQNQRVGIARAMILKPGLVIADEAVSALDVTIQAQIVQLLRELQLEYGMSMLFISHDLSVVRQLAHRIMVLYLGRVVELGSSEQVCASPEHPYTKALISAVPRPDPAFERAKQRLILEGDVPSPLDSRSSLRFLQSKMINDPDAEQYVPQLLPCGHGHYTAEHDPVFGPADSNNPIAGVS